MSFFPIGTRYFCNSIRSVLLGVAAVCAPVLAVDQESVSAEHYRSAALIKEATKKAGYILAHFRAIDSPSDADALAVIIEQSVKEDSVLWECLRRQGFMELSFFWEDSVVQPSHHEIILSLQKRQLWTPELRLAVNKWHARLGYQSTIWPHKLPLAKAELEWKRKEYAHELLGFKEQFSHYVGEGDGLSVGSALQVNRVDIVAMRAILMSYLHNVVNCGLANYALFSDEEAGKQHYLLQVHAVSRQLGQDYMFYFDISELMNTKGDATMPVFRSSRRVAQNTGMRRESLERRSRHSKEDSQLSGSSKFSSF